MEMERGRRSKGLTTNMINHMRDKHALIWNRAIAAEKRLTGGDRAGEKGLSDEAVTPTQKSEMVSIYSINTFIYIS